MTRVPSVCHAVLAMLLSSAICVSSVAQQGLSLPPLAGKAQPHVLALKGDDGIYHQAWMTPTFLLTSLGVYLGLIIRLNSWDIATRPKHVWSILLNALGNTLVLKTVAVFALLLWLAYEIANIWADGLALRIKQKRWF